jgi:hypothetical protein
MYIRLEETLWLGAGGGVGSVGVVGGVISRVLLTVMLVESVAAEVEEGIGGWSGESS